MFLDFSLNSWNEEMTTCINVDMSEGENDKIIKGNKLRFYGCFLGIFNVLYCKFNIF